MKSVLVCYNTAKVDKYILVLKMVYMMVNVSTMLMAGLCLQWYMLGTSANLGTSGPY